LRGGRRHGAARAVARRGRPPALVRDQHHGDHDDDGNHHADRDEPAHAEATARLRVVTARAARHRARPGARARRLRAAGVLPAVGGRAEARVPWLAWPPGPLARGAARAAALRHEEVLQGRVHPGGIVVVTAAEALRLLRAEPLLAVEVLALVILGAEAGTRRLARVVLAAELLLTELLLAEVLAVLARVARVLLLPLVPGGGGTRRGPSPSSPAGQRRRRPSPGRRPCPGRSRAPGRSLAPGRRRSPGGRRHRRGR